jgi:hypothetical protein
LGHGAVFGTVVLRDRESDVFGVIVGGELTIPQETLVITVAGSFGPGEPLSAPVVAIILVES